MNSKSCYDLMKKLENLQKLFIRTKVAKSRIFFKESYYRAAVIIHFYVIKSYTQFHHFLFVPSFCLDREVMQGGSPRRIRRVRSFFFCRRFESFVFDGDNTGVKCPRTVYYTTLFDKALIMIVQVVLSRVTFSNFSMNC